MFYGMGLFTGLIIGYLLNELIKKLNKGIEFKLLGYELYIGKSKKAEIVKMEKKKAPAKIQIKKCETCNDEDMYIAGTKNLIPCPKCKRNLKKFKQPI